MPQTYVYVYNRLIKTPYPADSLCILDYDPRMSHEKLNLEYQLASYRLKYHPHKKSRLGAAIHLFGSQDSASWFSHYLGFKDPSFYVAEFVGAEAEICTFSHFLTTVDFSDYKHLVDHSLLLKHDFLEAYYTFDAKVEDPLGHKYSIADPGTVQLIRQL